MKTRIQMVQPVPRGPCRAAAPLGPCRGEPHLRRRLPRGGVACVPPRSRGGQQGIFFKKGLKKFKFEKSAGLEQFNGREATFRPSNGGGRKIFLRPRKAPLREIKLFLFTKRPLTWHPARPTGGRSPEGHPALPTGGRFSRGASWPPNGRDVTPTI
ncbi:hypothetical protein PAHAL_2G204600 [Panicum hallii]|uniref:Uncharacterized protein n=1 Tax=Panicum hallii TaxID=206008 RepID=A0A2T8KPN9_9POAL|nr:hypothetical protein PAHAL_2G204600 [Panicum hallii]